MSIPQTVNFEGLKRPGPGPASAKCFYRILGFRPPRKGEFFLSGAVVMAYRASNDLMATYTVVEPTHWAVVPDHARAFARGPVVTL